MPIALPKGNGCIFCDQIHGTRADWGVIDEDADTIAIVNPRQFEEGQALVLPKRHAPTLLDLSDDEANALMRTVRRLARALVAAYDPDGLTVYQNNGLASRQEVPHTHVHVVPRRHGSGWGEGPPQLAALTRAEREARFREEATPVERLTEIAEHIRPHVAGDGA